MISDFSYTKSWRSSADFPTVENDETQVREDMQCLFDEVRDFINLRLIPAVNSLSPQSGGEESYTNLVRSAQAVDSSAVYNSVGYKNGAYISDGAESANANDCLTGCIPYEINGAQPTDVLYIKGYTGTGSASHTRLCARNAGKQKVYELNGFLSSAAIFDVDVLAAGYYKLTPISGVHESVSNVAYLQFSFAQPDGSGIIITKNEPIT